MDKALGIGPLCAANTPIQLSATEPQAGRESAASTHSGKIIEMPKVVFLVERFVYPEVSVNGLPRQTAELVLLAFWNDGKFGCLQIYPGLGSHTKQLAGRHEKVRLPPFVILPW